MSEAPVHPSDLTFRSTATDDLDEGQRWSTYWDVERSCRGPEPLPDRVVTDRAAIDTDLGVPKTGEEGRRPPPPPGPSRHRWRPARREAGPLRGAPHLPPQCRLHRGAGVAVPYPVQVDGTELLMELVTHDGVPAPRLAAAGERSVVIDLPQVVDVVANPAGADFLLRDCRHVCRWFRRRGLDVDEDELFGETIAQAW